MAHPKMISGRPKAFGRTAVNRRIPFVTWGFQVTTDLSAGFQWTGPERPTLYLGECQLVAANSVSATDGDISWSAKLESAAGAATDIIPPTSGWADLSDTIHTGISAGGTWDIPAGRDWSEAEWIRPVIDLDTWTGSEETWLVLRLMVPEHIVKMIAEEFDLTRTPSSVGAIEETDLYKDFEALRGGA